MRDVVQSPLACLDRRTGWEPQDGGRIQREMVDQRVGENGGGDLERLKRG